MDAAKGNNKHIRFAPVEDSHLVSVYDRTQVSSTTSCAYSCYHSTCCLSFSYEKNTERCVLSGEPAEFGTTHEGQAEVFITGKE